MSVVEIVYSFILSLVEELKNLGLITSEDVERLSNIKY
jgi:hypothetical protein